MKVGDKVIIKQSKYDWRQVYIGKIGIIISMCSLFEWIVRCKDVEESIQDACWYEKDLELYVAVGQQLEFAFMYED